MTCNQPRDNAASCKLPVSFCKLKFLAPDILHQSKSLEQVHARDAAYELIPFQQRRALHAQLARALEQGLNLDHVPPSALAYHWSQACRGVEALHPHTTLQVAPLLFYNDSCLIGGGPHLISILTGNLATNLSLHGFFGAKHGLLTSTIAVHIYNGPA